MLMIRVVAFATCLGLVASVHLRQRRTQCEPISVCEGPGLVHAAGSDRGHLFKPYSGGFTHRLVHDEEVLQATTGPSFVVYVHRNKTAYVKTAAHSSLQAGSVEGVLRAYAGKDTIYYELVNGSWLSAGAAHPPAKPRLVQEFDGLTIKHAAVGDRHAIFVLVNGSVLGTGWNKHGQLGLGDMADRDRLVRLPMEGVSSAAAGSATTYLVLEDGTVWVAGKNRMGRLGIGNTRIVETFRQIPTFHFWYESVVSASAGKFHALFLTNAGHVYGTGTDSLGQLGLGAPQSFSFPVRLPMQSVKQAQAGAYTSAFVLCSGEVLVNGDNWIGQLGLGDQTLRYKPVPIPGLKNVICAATGTWSTHTFYLMNEKVSD